MMKHRIMANIRVVCLLGLSLTFLALITVSNAQGNEEDPCSGVICKWGGLCQTDSFGYTSCVCPLTCYGPGIPVCTVYGLEFPNKCEMHRFACTNSISIKMQHTGSCVKNSTNILTRFFQTCPNLGHLLQFRDRYLEWMYVAMEIKNDRRFKLEKRITQLSISDKINVAKWEFNRCDKNKNSRLDPDEIKLALEAMLFEPCGFGFIASCDLDSRDGISHEEWDICLNLAERPLERS